MLMISDSTILELATPMLNSCFHVFCVAYVSSSSYHPTDNLKKVKKFQGSDMWNTPLFDSLHSGNSNHHSYLCER
jgi:hypothetical protein